jgi:hypothetical protein
LITARSSLAELILVPAAAVTTSPARRAAFAAGVPARTWPIAAPVCEEESLRTTPRKACSAFPLEISWDAIDLTVLEGIAKPTPSLPPELLSI